MPPPVVGQLPDEQDELPQRIGRFRICCLLGSGAYGTVYLAEDPILDRDVALKVLRSDAAGGDKARLRFLGEAKAAAQLHHPNIIPVFDAGTDGDVDYLAAEYIPGRTLEDELHRHQMDWGWAADVCRRLADALAYAHRLGIVHRDVKSNNVMVDQHGDVHLTDFGLARRLHSDEKLTKDGAVLGTAAYMAPEQASPDIGSVGCHSDQYSLGIILYELLCGEPPFSGPVAVVLYNCVHTEPTAPHVIVPDVPRDLEAICLKAIAKRPDDRYASCAGLSEDLRCWLADEPLVARPMGPFERLGRWSQRNPWVAGLAVAATVLMLIVASIASVALVRMKEVGRGLDQLVEENDALIADIQETENQISGLGKDIDILRQQNPELSQDNDRLRVEIVDLHGDLQRKVRQMLNRFLEELPAEWIFSEATGDATPPPDDSAEPVLASEGSPLVIDPPWLGVSVRGEALKAMDDEPFGVGVLSVQFPPAGLRWRSDEPMRLSGGGNVVYYPAYSPRALVADKSTPRWLQSLEVHFLFHGSEPLDLTLEIGQDCVINTTLPVTGDPQRQPLHMDQWWARYVRSSGDPAALTSGPSSKVRNYLVRMLAPRLRKRLSAGDTSYLLGPDDDYLRSYKDLLASETDDDTIVRLIDVLPQREAAIRHWQFEVWNSPPEFGPPGDGAAKLQLPSAERDPPRRTMKSAEPKRNQSAPITGEDDLATHVPQECYYARLANIEDAQHLVFGLVPLADDLRLFDTASLLGVDSIHVLLRQLALDGMLADHGMTEGLISDIAVIGTDGYFQDGAAVGVLVKARDSELLGAIIRWLRERERASSPDIPPKEKVVVDGHDVSLLQTDDASVRSFYAVSGDFHLISNSKVIVRRFFEAGRGLGSLTQNPQFQNASREFRADGNSAFWLFVSDDFWKHFLGVQPAIETLRRYRARADLELVGLARLAADAEAIPYEDIDDLIRAGLLPESIVMRPDRSRPQISSGVLSDSRRGVSGAFLPIPDVIEEGDIENGPISPFEAELCRSYARATKALRQLGPLVVTVSYPSPDAFGGGSVCLDVQFSLPLRELLARVLKDPGVVRILGPGRDLKDLLRPPSRARITPLPGDLAFVELAFRTEAWRTFFGFRDWEIPLRVHRGKVDSDQQRGPPESPSFYFGDTAAGGLLGRLTQGGYLPEDANGYATSVSDEGDALRFRRSYGSQWVAFSAKKETLEMLTQHQVAESGYRPAQIRIHLGNISESKLASTLRALAYMRARRLSGASALRLEELQQQFHLTPSETREVADEYYRGKSVCPLGGRYTWSSQASIDAWTGTAWSRQSLFDETKVPDNYRLPLIDQLRGADVSLELAENQIQAHIELNFKTD